MITLKNTTNRAKAFNVPGGMAILEPGETRDFDCDLDPDYLQIIKDFGVVKVETAKPSAPKTAKPAEKKIAPKSEKTDAE